MYEEINVLKHTHTIGSLTFPTFPISSLLSFLSLSLKVPPSGVPGPRAARLPVYRRPAPVPLHQGAADGGVLDRHPGLEDVLVRHVRAGQEFGPHQRVLTRGELVWYCFDPTDPFTILEPYLRWLTNFMLLEKRRSTDFKAKWKDRSGKGKSKGGSRNFVANTSSWNLADHFCCGEWGLSALALMNSCLL